MTPVLQLEGVVKMYRRGDEQVHVLVDFDFTLDAPRESGRQLVGPHGVDQRLVSSPRRSRRPRTAAGKPVLANNFRLAIERLPTTWMRTIAPVAFRRTTGGVVPSDLLLTLSDVVLTDGVGAGPIVAGPADHGESTRVRPAAR